jgi:hypothetical protein
MFNNTFCKLSQKKLPSPQPHLSKSVITDERGHVIMMSQFTYFQSPFTLYQSLKIYEAKLEKRMGIVRRMSIKFGKFP